MRAGGDPEARRELARDRGAADLVGGLEHDDLAPRAREVGGADEAVVAGADDDDAIAVSHRCQPSGTMFGRRRSSRISRAALAPGRRHDAAARVRAGAAHVEARHRPAILRVARERPVEQQLVHRQLALEDVALGEADLVLELARRAALRRGGPAA